MIKFAENFAEVYPAGCSTNLADLPKDQRDAIKEDFRRWALAAEMFKRVTTATTDLLKGRADNEVRAWLLSLEPKPYQDDMRRRLNILKAKK